jgi:hypothetical protein
MVLVSKAVHTGLSSLARGVRPIRIRYCPSNLSPKPENMYEYLPVQAVYVPADDLTDPAPATTFTHLDASTVLSRGIAELGIYPAVDPLRCGHPRILVKHWHVVMEPLRVAVIRSCL